MILDKLHNLLDQQALDFQENIDFSEDLKCIDQSATIPESEWDRSLDTAFPPATTPTEPR